MSKKLDDMTEPELKRLLNTLANAMYADLPNGTAFVLLLAPFGGPVAQYMTNAQRSDCVAWMREAADCLEEHGDVTR